MYTLLLLIVSNAFMTLAWYGHLKLHGKPMWLLIAMSWGIALFEYIFQVPANRLGVSKYHFSIVQLKIVQECITLAVFSVIAYLMFGQTLRWNHWISYTLIVGAVYFAFIGGGASADDKAALPSYQIHRDPSPSRAAAVEARQSADAA